MYIIILLKIVIKYQHSPACYVPVLILMHTTARTATVCCNVQAIKKDNSFRSQQHSKLTLWRGFLFVKSSESDDSLTIFSLDPHTTQNETLMHRSLTHEIGAIKVTRYSIGALLLVALFVWSAFKLGPTWCFYMVLLCFS